MNTKTRLHKALIFISILYLTLFIPTMIATFSTKWHEYNYDTTIIKKQISKDEYKNYMQDLNSYMTYQSELDEKWTEKEKKHYRDVRNLYLIGYILFIASTVTLLLLLKKYNNIVSKSAISNIIILAITATVILLFFDTFWNDIFHPLLFNNDNYIMNSDDLSFYLFPAQFFVNTTTLILSISIIINVAIYTLLKTQKLIKTSQPKKTK